MKFFFFSARNRDSDTTAAAAVPAIDDHTVAAATDAAAETVVDANMDVQINGDMEEDDGERYSSHSLSSADEDNGGVVNNPGMDGGRCDATDTATSPPPDVIMHHNQNGDAVKRKGSRRGRRGRRSSNTQVAGGEQAPSPPVITKTLTVSDADVDLRTIFASAVFSSFDLESTNHGHDTATMVGHTDADNIGSTCITVIGTTSEISYSQDDSDNWTVLQSLQVRLFVVRIGDATGTQSRSVVCRVL